MINSALGLVEVKGYVGAVAVADAALKAANVKCLGLEKIKGGLVTVKLDGDVGAVRAAVDAGAEVATNLNVFLTKHVIPKLHEGTVAMVASGNNSNQKSEQAPSSPTSHEESDMKNYIPQATDTTTGFSEAENAVGQTANDDIAASVREVEATPEESTIAPLSSTNRPSLIVPESSPKAAIRMANDETSSTSEILSNNSSATKANKSTKKPKKAGT
ncbi:BMC domain-containing protein [Brevibacillus daliensis]|uniref:BMC domain-containing protein n=1 Tax=Brevibacillus daliensis TaxID=2892995 RepID=UPI0027145CF2|nr:BMC domain-containing protein [Brevibacillus daliensis]